MILLSLRVFFSFYFMQMHCLYPPAVGEIFDWLCCFSLRGVYLPGRLVFVVGDATSLQNL